MYLGDSGRIFTTGFSRFNDREYCVWSQHDLSKALERDSIDSSSGVLFPFYDYDTKIIFLAGKGDGNVRYCKRSYQKYLLCNINASLFLKTTWIA